VELRKAPTELQRQTRAIRCESAPENKNKRRTDLHAYQIWVLDRYVQLCVKILHHRHGLSTSDIESSISGALLGQSFDRTPPIRVACMIRCSDLDVLEEILEAQALAVGKLARGESVWWLPTSTKKIEAEGDDVSGLVHSTRRNIDVD